MVIEITLGKLILIVLALMVIVVAAAAVAGKGDVAPAAPYQLRKLA